MPGPREEIDIIGWVFNQYAFENKGYHKIVSELNQQQVSTEKVGTWSVSTICAIIFNESYIGSKIITKNAHPALITKELFEQCSHCYTNQCL
ncbi:recombinase family protein [Paenibacillus sp. FSL R10-2778]|uniref:recombinase family protein n=1 Tax=unclassified Paenibacillus TaxID=185978 RepID=UPI003158992B